MTWTDDDGPVVVDDAVTAAAGWQDSVAAPDSRTDELEAAFSKLWFGQLNLVIGRLRERAQTSLVAAAGDQPFTVASGSLFDAAAWAAMFDEIAADAVADQVVAGATDAAVAGDVSEEALRRAVREHVDVVAGVAPYLDDSVAKVVADAMAERLTLNETVERLRTVSGLSDTAARATARTEAVAAANAGLAAVWASSPGVERKQWEALDDGRTRPAHEAADGQQVTLTSTFSIGGYAARYPGDPRLPIGLRINCRCRIIPVAPDGARGFRSLTDATFEVLRRIAGALGLSRGTGPKPDLVSRVRRTRRGDNLSVDRMNYRQRMEQARRVGVKGRWRMTPLELGAALVALGYAVNDGGDEALVAHLAGKHNQRSHGNGATGHGVWKDGEVVSGSKASGGSGGGAGGASTVEGEPGTGKRTRDLLYRPEFADPEGPLNPRQKVLLDARKSRDELGDDETEEALFAYTGGDYAMVNGGLRSPGSVTDEEKFRTTVRGMDHAFDTVGVKNTQRISVYRGVSDDFAERVGGMSKGERIRDDGYLSTSTDRLESEIFTNVGQSAGGKMMVINVPAGHTTIPGDDMQSELIFGRGSTLEYRGPNARGDSMFELLPYGGGSG